MNFRKYKECLQCPGNLYAQDDLSHHIHKQSACYFLEEHYYFHAQDLSLNHRRIPVCRSPDFQVQFCGQAYRILQL